MNTFNTESLVPRGKEGRGGMGGKHAPATDIIPIVHLTKQFWDRFSLRGGHPPGTTVKCGSRDCVQSWKHNLCEQQHRPPYQGGGCIGVGGRAVLIGDMQRSEL